MSLKAKLQISFIVVFVFVFTQIAFPLGVRVNSITVKDMDNIQNLPIFENLEKRENISNDGGSIVYFTENLQFRNNEHKYRFVDYEVSIEGMRLIPIKILDSKILVDDKYKNYVLAGVIEQYDKVISITKKTNFKFKLIVDSTNLSEEEITEMLKSIDVNIKWRAVSNWQRENKTYLPKNLIINY